MVSKLEQDYLHSSDVVRACVSVTPDNPSVVYALFGDNNNGYYGVYKSTDEGDKLGATI